MRAPDSSSRRWTIDTPMDEPEAAGLTTQGTSSRADRAGMSSAVYFTSSHLGVATPRGATMRLVRSLSIAMALPR